jgi:integrase
MTPDFADWLLQTPLDRRIGKVFGVAALGLRLDKVSKVVSEIGKRAGVVVNREQGKFASAHDFRRAFGTRWASRLKPADLQQLMRHVSITTTLGYYVLVDADTLAQRLWDENKPLPIQESSRS